jgi:hypothetical protein
MGARRTNNAARYECLMCRHSAWQINSTVWRCQDCGQEYPCVKGVPKLYIESRIGPQDRELRDNLYDGLLGTYYQHVMPFLALPVRPARAYWRGWAAYATVLLVLLTIVAYATRAWFSSNGSRWSVLNVGGAFACVLICYGFFRHPYLLYLIVLAIPVRVSTLLTGFKPVETLTGVHARLIQELLGRTTKLQVLDVSTGTCNSLYRHGWMTLNADYTGLDLSETMLQQGREFMAEKQIPMDFVLADAADLPFPADTFDVVLSYGAVNGLNNPQRALEEMARVAKKGGFFSSTNKSTRRHLRSSASISRRSCPTTTGFIAAL